MKRLVLNSSLKMLYCKPNPNDFLEINGMGMLISKEIN